MIEVDRKEKTRVDNRFVPSTAIALYTALLPSLPFPRSRSRKRIFRGAANFFFSTLTFPFFGFISHIDLNTFAHLVVLLSFLLEMSPCLSLTLAVIALAISSVSAQTTFPPTAVAAKRAPSPTNLVSTIY